MFNKIDLRGIKQSCPFIGNYSVCCAGFYNDHHELNYSGQYLCQCDQKKLDVV